MTNEAFATADEVELYFRRLTGDEFVRVEALLPAVSDLLRQQAVNHGKNLDEMISSGQLSKTTVAVVTCDVIGRILRADVTNEPMTSFQQSAMGYSFQGTYAIPGGGMAGAIMNNDLKRLGIISKQRIGVIDTYDSRCNC